MDTENPVDPTEMGVKTDKFRDSIQYINQLRELNKTHSSGNQDHNHISNQEGKLTIQYQGNPLRLKLVGYMSREQFEVLLTRLGSINSIEEQDSLMEKYKEEQKDDYSIFRFYKDAVMVDFMNSAKNEGYLELSVSLDPNKAVEQLTLFEQYFDIQDKDSDNTFESWFNQTITADIEERKAIFERARPFKQFLDMVKSSLESRAFKDLETRLFASSSDIAGMKEVIERVNAVSQRNLISNLYSMSEYGEMFNIYILAKGLSERGDNLIEDPVFDSLQLKPVDILDESFWSRYFPAIVEKLIRENKMFLLHNMNNSKSLRHNLSNGMGRSTFNIPGDVAETYLGNTQTPQITYSILAIDDPLYAKGASMGGGKYQAKLSLAALANRTIFFPYDTGDPQTMSDYDPIERESQVLNVIGATELFLVRHIRAVLYDQLAGLKRSNEDARYLGNFGFVEGNTLGNIQMTTQTVESVVMPKNSESVDIAEQLVERNITHVYTPDVS